MRLPYVDTVFKKNKRRRELLICLSFAILWILTISVILAPCSSCSEDSSNDVSLSDVSNQVTISSDSRNGNVLFNFGSSESTAFKSHDQSLNTKILRIRKRNGHKRKERHRRNEDGSGDDQLGDDDTEMAASKQPVKPTSNNSRSFLESTITLPSNDEVENSILSDNVTSAVDTAVADTSTSATNDTTTTTENTTPTTTTPTTTTRDPCYDVLNVAPSRVWFPPGNLLAYRMRVRLSMDKPLKIPVKYGVSIHEKEGDLIDYQVGADKVFNVTNLLPCTTYTACVVAIFEGCPESTSVCSSATTATDISNVNISNHKSTNDAKYAVIHFDRPDTACNLNYSLTVNGNVYIFNGENDFTPFRMTINSTMNYGYEFNRDRPSFNLTGLLPYTSYEVKVWAESATSKSQETVIGLKTKPSSPTEVRNVSATCGASAVDISWEAPENFNGKFEHYKLTVRPCLTNGTDCQRVELDVNLNESKFKLNISTTKPEHHYQFQIRAKTLEVDTYGKSVEKYATCKTPAPSPTEDSNVVLVVAWLITFILLLVLLGFLLTALQRKNIIKLPFVHKWCQSGQSSPDPTDIPFRVTSKPVKLADFQEHYQKMTADSFFKVSQEFEELVSGSPSYPTTVAQMNENRPKNRWINILPFDHSRVKLLPIADDVFTDYINASYIPGYRSQREFIASQGPLANTKDDFWRMVWEQNCPMIVMVTQCVERGKEKCEKYWPEDRETHYYGDLAVNLKSESILSGYTLRIFDLRLKMRMTTSPTAIDLSDLLELIPRFPELEKGSRTMEVKQMHFTMWPDFGCPENTSLLINFVGSVRDHMPHNSTGPIIVHCSAGVGRTGTFIAVDKLMQHIEDHDFVDIFATVREMRNYRTNMVQTEDQYMYIHECVKDLLIDMQTRTPIGKDNGESMVDIIGMAQSDTPSRKRPTESSVRDGCDPEMTETAVLLSVTTEASDLTDTVLSDFTDTTSVLSDQAVFGSEPHGDADHFNDEFVRESQKLLLSSRPTNRMSHDSNDIFSDQSLCLQPTNTSQLAGDSTDIPQSALTQACTSSNSDIWYM